jgi:hypothetical protein
VPVVPAGGHSVLSGTGRSSVAIVVANVPMLTGIPRKQPITMALDMFAVARSGNAQIIQPDLSGFP